MFAPLGCAWWIAGGWAIDLHVGRETRAHGDMDIALLRRDCGRVAELLGDWDVQIAHDGELRPWDAEPLPVDRHQFWARRRGHEAWAFEVLLEETSDDAWVYRRDGRVTLPLAEIGHVLPDGVPYLRPGVALLYKSPPGPDMERNSRNNMDFEAVVGSLPDADRRWLRAALGLTAPGHRWIAALNAAGAGW